LDNWASALSVARRFDDALKVHEAALSRKQKALGPTHFDVGVTLSQISSTYSKLGQFQEAMAYNDRALSITEAALGRKHPRVGVILSNRSEIAAGLGRYYEAKEDAERSYDLWSHNRESADNPLLAFPLSAIGIAELGLGHPQRAVSPLARALALSKTGKVPITLTETRFALAQALWSTRRDRPAAIDLARTSLEEATALERPTVRDLHLRTAMQQWWDRVGAGRGDG
jgi:eukaryotic-like serine/threonine-protein kinase